MTLLFMGGEISAFTASGGGAAEVADNYNSSFARCALSCDGTSANPDGVWADTAIWSVQTGDFYLHWEDYTLTAIQAPNYIALLDDSGDEIIRIQQTDDSPRTVKLQYLSALSVWTDAATGIEITGTRTDYDLFVNVTTGEIGYFSGGSRREQVTGLSLSHLAGVAQARFYSTISGTYYSQVIADTNPTIGRRLATAVLTGAGATSAWTLSNYANIDELRYSDADLIYSDTANQVSTFALTVPSLTGYNVVAVGVAARAKCGGGGPQNLQLAIRSNSTNYFSSSQAQDVAYGAYFAAWETDPATSAAWVDTAAAAIQAGVKSIA